MESFCTTGVSSSGVMFLVLLVWNTLSDTRQVGGIQLIADLWLKIMSVTAFSLRTPLTSLQTAPQYCIHPSTNRFYPPPPSLATLPTKPEAGRHKRGRGLCAVEPRRPWLPGYISTSPGVTGSEVLLYLGCPQCLGECEFVPLFVAVTRPSVGTDVEEDPLGQR